MSDHAEELLDLTTQREDQRVAVYAAARLSLADGADQPCEVLNISAGGAMIRLDPDGISESIVSLDLQDVGSFPSRVAWVHNRFVGLAFSSKIEGIDELVQSISAAEEENVEKRRFKRTSVLWRGQLYTAGKTHQIRVMNISAGGAKLRGPSLAEDTAIMLIVERVGEVPARVVWADHEQLGIRFLDEPGKIRELFGDLLPALRQSLE